MVGKTKESSGTKRIDDMMNEYKKKNNLPVSKTQDQSQDVS